MSLALLPHMPLSATVAATSGGCRHQSAVQFVPPSPPDPLPLELLDVLELPLLPVPPLLLPLVLPLPLLVLPLLLLPLVPLLLALPLPLALDPLLLPEPPVPELLPLPTSDPDPPHAPPATPPAIKKMAATPRPDCETLFITMFGSSVSLKAHSSRQSLT